MNIKYVSIESILAKINRDYGKQLDEGDVIEWVGEALDGLIAGTVAFEKKIAVINVIDNQCILPDNCEAIIQIARNNFEPINHKFFDVSLDINAFDENGLPVDITNATKGLDVQIIPYMEVYYSSRFWNSSALREKFSPVRLSNSTFFDELVPKEFLDNPFKYNKYEYQQIGNQLRFNFRDGQIMIAYYKRMVDRNNIPMIPDNYVYKTAIGKYIIYKIAEKAFYNNVQGSDSRLVKAEQDWKLYREQARALALIPDTIDEMEKLVRNHTKLVRPTDRYENFFDDNYPNYPNYFRDDAYPR